MEEVMEIIENKALRVRTPNPALITACVPKSKQLGDDEVLVSWDVGESMFLRDLNFKVPAPITGRYDWPGRYKPMDHQKKTAAFMTMNKRAFCFNEQGTGKTASAIWAADFLMTRGFVRRALVVCPLSIMDSAWRADLFSFAMHRKVDIAYGSSDKRKKIINSDAEFVIINYDGVNVVEDEIKKGGFDLFIVDEASHYKNTQTQRWKCLNRLVGLDDWLWMMTGTPAAQGPMDAFGLAKLVNPKDVPRTAGVFRDMVMFQKTRFRWEPKPTAIDTVHRVLQPAIRFTKDECLDLPDMVYVKRNVPMTKQQEAYYKKLKKDFVLQLEGADVTTVNAAVNMNKLLQISAGAVYTDEGDTIEFDISARYNVLREVIDESSHKVLIFVPFKSMIRMLSERLAAEGIVAETISGEVSAGRRSEIFKAFQTTPNPQVLVIQPQSAAHGVTLTAANTVVWWSPTASLEIFAQANARVHRSGQVNKCTVVQLHSSPVEQRIYSMLEGRIDVHSKVVDLYRDLLD
jgi:SNF2 family DNA or RNA helicase